MIVDTSERRIHVESSQPQRVKEGIITLRCDKHALIMKTGEAVKLAEWILVLARKVSND